MKNLVAVVGSNGFLGSHLTNSLLKLNNDVIAVHNSKTDNIPDQALKLSSQSFLKLQNIPKDIYFAVGNYASAHSDLLEINELLSEICKKFPHSKIIYVSSTNVYGIHEETISLNSTFNRPMLYALSKIAGEFIVSNHKEYSIVRLTYLYGENINNTSFLPSIISSAKEKGEITLFGDGNRSQDYLYIDDAVSLCIASAALNTNEILIGASGTSTSNKEVATLIRDYINCDIKYIGKEESSSFSFDISNTLTKVDWTAKTSFQFGLNKMLSS